MFDVKKTKDACVRWIRDWFEENGPGCNAVIGISGGKDSSVVAGLCVEALGVDRVIGVTMPNGVQPDIDDSIRLINHLGIKRYDVNIGAAYDALMAEVELKLGHEASAQTRINMAPRLRMTALYAVSQSNNGRVANTCNLSEDWVGYSTRYGDAAGDFSPLGGLTVQEVVAIGKELGLPVELVEKTPSDGLCGKTDEDNLGFTYAVLDRYIRTGVCEDPDTKALIDRKHVMNLFKLKPIPHFDPGSWSPRANGHCYLNLTQSDRGKPVADIRAMIWKWHFPQLKAFFEQETGQTLQAGITVLVRVQVSFSEMFGMSLFIDDIDPAFTVGEQALAKKKAIEKLTTGGYLEMQQELAIPRLPYRLAVITSKTAAGYGDFRRHLLENEAGYAFRLDLYEALMQGEQAPASIIAALAEAQEHPCDAILILRGGGSEMDLACFDDYDLAVAIATCAAPVVTAIGHDRDFHIADLVANRSVKTPTALADLFLDAYAAEDALLDDLQARVRRAVADRLGGMLRKVDSLAQRLRFAAGARIDRARAALDLKEALIKASDPRKILSMGYALVTGRDGKVLKSVAPVAAGDRIGVRFADGTIRATVDSIDFSTSSK